MEKVQVFTSTGSKLIHHPEVIYRIKEKGQGSPVSLQIAPTSRCNLKCVFCSNVNRDKHEDLDPCLIKKTLGTLKTLGLKTVEWTGGGDPTQYKHINECISFAGDIGLQQGLISNGIDIKNKLTGESLKRLHWMRVSMNCLDYVSDIGLPDFDGTLGFSYVMNDKTDREIFARIDYYIKTYKPQYVRIVPNCQATHAEQEKNNEIYSRFVEDSLGEPYFYQVKAFEKPDNCYWCYFKPFLLHDGWVYPCSSVVLNEDSERQFHKKYRWVKAVDLPSVYSGSMEPFDPVNCSHCVFTAQNNQLIQLLNPNGMVNFV